MLLTIASRSPNAAQLFFLLAALIAAIAIVLAMTGHPQPLALLGIAAVGFVALGLVFTV